MEKERNDWEKEITRYLESHPKVALAFLFGSQGRGKARAGSDVDVAVYLRPPFHAKEVTAIWNQLEDITRQDVDLVVLNDAPPGISWTAFRGRLLVNKDPRRYLEEMLRLSREAEEFREFLLDFWDLRRSYRRDNGEPVEHLESLIRRLDFLRLETQDLPKFQAMTQQEYMNNRDRRRNLERLIENVVNASTDIAKIILAARDLPVPDSYRQALLQLGTAGIVEPDLAEKIAEMTRLRNVLAHQYLDIRWQSVRNFIREAPPVMERFLDRLEEFVASARHVLASEER